MIDLNECHLYQRNSDGKKFLSKKITKNDYVLIDPENLEKFEITYSKLRVAFSMIRKSIATRLKRQRFVEKLEAKTDMEGSKRLKGEYEINLDSAKTCSKCRKGVHTTQFRVKDGKLSSWCRQCERDACTKYREKKKANL